MEQLQHLQFEIDSYRTIIKELWVLIEIKNVNIFYIFPKILSIT